MPSNRIRFSNDFILRNSQVGFGTSSPRAKLDVIGNALVSGNAQVTGNLGVGTITNPTITGITSFIGVVTTYTVSNPGISTNIVEIKPYVRNVSTLSFQGYGNQILTVDDDSTDSFAIYSYTPRPFTNPFLNRETGQVINNGWSPIAANYDQLFRIDNSGKVIVGIGTTITAKLDVRGNVNLGPVFGSPGSLGTSTPSHNITGNTTFYGDLNFYGLKIRPRIAYAPSFISTSNYVEISPNPADGGALNFTVGTSSTTLIAHNILSLTNNVVGSLFRVNELNVSFGSTTNLTTAIIAPIFEVNSNNNVGVGTTIPTAKVHVVGNTLITGITTVGLGSTSSPSINSTMSFELTNNTTLTVRVRGTDGTIRTGTITLT